jgi:hypothetical protein
MDAYVVQIDSFTRAIWIYPVSSARPSAIALDRTAPTAEEGKVDDCKEDSDDDLPDLVESDSSESSE